MNYQNREMLQSNVLKIVEREKEFRLLFFKNPLPLFVYDAETLNIKDVNDVALELYGYKREEFSALTLSALFPDEERQMIEKQLAGCPGRTLRRGIWPQRRADGLLMNVELISHTFGRDGRPAVIVFAQDRTYELQIESELQLVTERYRRMLEDDITAYYTSKPDGTIAFCNAAFVHMFGFISHEEVLAQNIRSFYLSPEERDEVLALLIQRKLLRHFPLRFRRKDGSPIHLIANVIGMFDALGNLTEVSGYLYDVSERFMLEESLRQIQKMDGIGALAGGVAHDLNNILSIIRGNVSLLADELGTSESPGRRLSAIDNAVDRGSDLVRQILVFARKHSVEIETIEVNAEISGIIRLIEGTFPKTIEIALTASQKRLCIKGDRNQLHQALLNLCVNARDAILDNDMHGKLTIATRMESGDAVQTLFPEASEACYVALAVSDTGVGMSEDTQQKLFEPFFTTKKKGTGLGLPVVYGVVRSLQGFVHVNSKLGQGSTFTLYIPAAAELTNGQSLRQAEANLHRRGTETILLVEDEPMLLELLASTLTSCGYNVLAAHDGEEGMATYLRQSSDISLIVTDFDLPKFTGIELLEKARSINPEVRAVVMSGYLEPEKRLVLETVGVQGILQKPFLNKEMLQRVREVLDER